MNRYVCVHGHFYQPPRENAWLDTIEVQESASPFHDWNERITRECYETNGFSRILNQRGRIVDIVNNYARMSFNFGPTLLSWIEPRHPQVYKAILEADKLSLELFDGHGSAMAQVYNHIIMPLSSLRDKRTQVRWGIADFKHRFNRMPEGMWLAETAVDIETLEVLAEEGILFTVLAPSQAAEVRPPGSDQWQPFSDGRRAYTHRLPSGRSIALFFYDGPRSRDVAFNGSLNDGLGFAKGMVSGLDENPQEPQLLHIAADGETFGHHHRHGDMALAFGTRYIEENSLAQVTNYSQFLELAPPTWEVVIHQNSSWSCAHGVERWRSDCGCHTGGEAHWNQKWRTPLRQAITELSSSIEKVYHQVLGEGLKPLADRLRDQYIQLMLAPERNAENSREWFSKMLGFCPEPERITELIRALEMEKNALFAQTSCAWFFNDLSGIETTQVLQYACRSIQLADTLTGIDLEARFLELLSDAQSNVPGMGTGADLYRRFVLVKRLSLTQVGIHYAVRSLFDDSPDALQVLNYTAESEELVRIRAGMQILAIGRTKVTSNVTLSEKRFGFAILYLGNHHLIGNTADQISEEEFRRASDTIANSFNSGHISQTIDVIKSTFAERSFSFQDLFLDEQLNLLDRVLAQNIEMALSSYERINDRVYSLLNVMRNNKLTIPPLLMQNLRSMVNHYLEELLGEEQIEVSMVRLKELVGEVSRWDLYIDVERLNFITTNRIHFLIESYKQGKYSERFLTQAVEVLDLLSMIGVKPELHELQNFIFGLLLTDDLSNPHFTDRLHKLAERIGFEVGELRPSFVPILG